MKSHQFAQHLEKATTPQQAKKILKEYLSTYGIKAYAFTYYSGHIKTGRKLRFDCVSDKLRPWHLHYLEQAYADVDRTLEQNHTMTLPLFWSIEDQLKTAKNKRELRIRKESRAFGIDKGLSVPVHGPHHDFAILTLHQFKDEVCLQHFSELQYEWLSATHIFYHTIKRILTLNDAPQSQYQLTRREEQCLLFTAQGWRVEQIAKELKITPRTVNFHIQNANRKLGTNNKYQAISKLTSSS
jgi:LuxR family transcriptional activator of bioluminescence operon